ncbi:deoxyuridine 5'-triphosphate nucleotidohydrolase, putative [Entamoeba invadens IP1]|uniref:Deoxyuridine 5'-triphosphate nucleotidohydrolase n=1 Tax=Entamoeba invadens IP1 TaxID=370355 RepID=A0A0A1U6F2_ENTIV|nr:deoxyuridine 5'-triphosphate nucleotidohydrolase, putative [Entamoeba invadens IP1]ELP89998.1 deoxyuridine 5'-triphosphate nucleotidohydrolase, putative [Entamoeba invadens IP1]|eukprot:XP_004256769.1 deoxyuridine 5'-triphosphate nucleotidohydrolase, putative [Entamoeba invadens IP1]
MERLYIKKLHPDAIIPTRGSVLAAGYDLYSYIDFKISPHSWLAVPTGIAVHIPSDCYGRVAPRSSLTLKNGLDVGAGVVDEDYRGEIKVILFNHSDVEFKGSKGDRIAQMVIERICKCPVVEVDDLNETERGSSGFGSTGK